MLLLRKIMILLLLSLGVVQALIGYKMIPFVTKVEVSDNTKYAKSTVQIYRPENTFDLSITLKNQIPIPRVSVVLYLDVGAGALKAPFYNQTIDMCGLIKNPEAHRMAQIVLRVVKRYGNFPKTCPISVGLYQFRGIPLNQTRLPPFFMETDVMLDIVGLTGAAKERTIQSRWFATLKRIKCTAVNHC